MGLLNALATADGADDRAQAGRLVSTALGGVFAVLLGLFALLDTILPRAQLLNVAAGLAGDARTDDGGAHDLRPAVAAGEPRR